MTEPYELEGFAEAFEEWLKREDVDQPRRVLTVSWIMALSEQPYHGARRVDELPNYWYAKVPRTSANDAAVCCSYWIYEKTKTVKCDNFGLLSEPF